MATAQVTLNIEPGVGSTVHYLKCAPSNAANNEAGCISIHLGITNNGSGPIHIRKIEISVVGNSTPAKEFVTDLTIAAGTTVGFTLPEDYTFGRPNNPELKLQLFRGDVNPFTFTRTLQAYTAPTPEGSFRFWGAIRDLRPGEFWQMHGTSHGQTWEQFFAYDVGVAVNDASQPNGYNTLLPGTDGSKNEHYRIWNKPIYSITDGVVTDFRLYFPTNPIPGQIPAELENFWQSEAEGGYGKDGGGNNIQIATGKVIVGYCHLRTNSLNPKLLKIGAVVKRGDFLGLAGNSGASSGPHLHIGANVTSTKFSLPMPFHNAHAIGWNSLQEPLDLARWVKLDGRGVPIGDCAVWPSDSKVVELKNVSIRHCSIGTDGRLWIVTTSNRIISSSDPISVSGVYMDQATGGAGHEITVRGQKPYVIGMDDKLWTLESNGWAPVSGSPSCLRIALDVTSGRLWIVATNNHIWAYNPPTDNWFESPTGRAKDVCVLKGRAYVIGLDDKIWKRVGEDWEPLPGNWKAKRIAADEVRNRLWHVTETGTVFWTKGDGTSMHASLIADAKDIYVHNGTPYLLGSDNALWKSAFKFGWSKMNVVEPK